MPDIRQVDEAFVRQYESEVHAAYQSKGGYLRKTVRNKTNVTGESTTFQKVGTGTAAQKTRKGLVPLMNIDHSNVTCLMEDWFAADYIDKFDELKINHDERKVIVEAGAWALGRKTDEMIIGNLNLGSHITGNYSTAFTKTLASGAIKKMNLRRVPDDRQRFAALTPGSWEHFINISEVKSADYAGDLYPWLKGTEAILWRGIVWQQVPGLPGEGTSEAKNFLYHMTAAACATAADVRSAAVWEEQRYSTFVNNAMSQGAVLINNDGVEVIHVNDTVDVT